MDAQTLLWDRVDVPGMELAFVDTSDGLVARGTQIAVDPLAYCLRYELRTRPVEGFVLRAHAEGAGWTRKLELAFDGSTWTNVGHAIGAPDLAAFDGQRVREPAPPGFVDADALAAAVMPDLGGSPLTNSLPVRALRMHEAEPGETFTVVSAWVLPPTLEVAASRQRYTVLSPGVIRYADAGTTVEVRYDEDGWVVDYPGLAKRR